MSRLLACRSSSVGRCTNTSWPSGSRWRPLKAMGLGGRPWYIMGFSIPIRPFWWAFSSSFWWRIAFISILNTGRMYSQYRQLQEPPGNPLPGMTLECEGSCGPRWAPICICRASDETISAGGTSSLHTNVKETVQ
ncbi:hypothetical protein AOLI_G00116910 [Acnodon oligacanthus]